MIFTNSNHKQELFLSQLAFKPAVLVQINSTQGSVPREAGTWMAVFNDVVVGTIGGGHLEHQTIDQARSFLQADAKKPLEKLIRFALGPSLGQCCGGVVHLRFERVFAENIPALTTQLCPSLWPVALFGGGHVGHALVQVLSNLPFALSWIDSRDDVFPASVPANVVCEVSSPVQWAVRQLPAQSRVLIMSFSHAEDFDVLVSCLERQRESFDLPYIGLIGSQTKWASFRSRLEARGFQPNELAHITSPIGVPGITGKEPEMIAVAVAAQLLMTCNPL